MPGFNYTAIDRNGKRVRSSLDASSIETAKSSLRGAGYTILDIKEQTTLNRDIEIPFLGKPKAKAMREANLRNGFGSLKRTIRPR